MSEGEYVKYNRSIPMERKQNGFTGISIPLEMLEFDNGTLSLAELFILSEIEYFCRVGSYKACIVNNQHFMDMIGISERTVKRALSHLELLGAISISKKGYNRVIKYNADAFKTKYSDVEYSDDLSDDNLSNDMTKCHETMTKCHEGVPICQNSTLYEENKEENNKKQENPAIISKKHSHIYNSKKARPLSHPLSDTDKYIAEQLKAKKKSPKELFRDECLEIIEHEYSDSTADLLTDYFNFISDPKQADSDNKMKVIKTVSAWRKKLDRLEELVKEGYDYEKLIKQSLENKTYVFYPLESVDKNTQYNNQRNKYEPVDVIPTQMTHEEILAEKQRRLDAGAKIY